jgi:MFS family permease
MSITALFRSTRPVPDQYRSNFFHLYLDIAWFGILSGSSLAFLSVYATRLGARGFEIGLLGAMPAVVNLIFAMPAGQWLQARPADRAVFWTSVAFRFGYLLWIPLPWLFGDRLQVWILIALALLQAVPGTALAVGFNAMFAEAVPADWRAYVAGLRNVMLSIVYILTSLGCGWILNNVPFPTGYQIVFGLGFIGGAMSSYHLYHVRALTQFHPPHPLFGNPQPTVPRRPLIPAFNGKALRLDIWKTPFRKVLLVLLGFHLSQYLAIPIFPLYFVRALHLNDQQIGIGTAAFYLTVFIGSTQLARFSRRLGHRGVTGVGVIALGLFPLILSFARGFGLFLITNLVGGFAWSLVGGALANYLLEKVPDQDRPPYLAWYNIMLNIAILTGSLAGPLFAGWTGLTTALVVFAILRFLAGISILRWG